MIEEFVAILRCKRFLQDQVAFVCCGIFTALIPGFLLVKYFRSRWVSYLPNILIFIEFLMTVVSLDSHFFRQSFL